MHNNKLALGRAESYARSRLMDLVTGQDNDPFSRVFHYGLVINNSDSSNANRLRIRIPLLDDVLYQDEDGQIRDSNKGDDLLPWCLTAFGRLIETPEVNTVILVAIFDPSSPFLGRVWFAPVPELTKTSLFDPTRLNRELSKNWSNAETAIETSFGSTPGKKGSREISSKYNEDVKFPVGIRGKDKNKILLNKGKTSITQNEGENNESRIDLSEKVSIKSLNLELLSTQSTSGDQNPAFGKSVYDFFDKILSLQNSILSTLSSTPSFNGGPGTPSTPIPNLPNPTMASLLAQCIQLQAELGTLRQPGQGLSQFLKIN
jgi:hypothetical protein